MKNTNLYFGFAYASLTLARFTWSDSPDWNKVVQSILYRKPGGYFDKNINLLYPSASKRVPTPLILSYLQCLLHDNGEAGYVQCLFSTCWNLGCKESGEMLSCT